MSQFARIAVLAVLLAFNLTCPPAASAQTFEDTLKEAQSLIGGGMRELLEEELLLDEDEEGKLIA